MPSASQSSVTATFAVGGKQFRVKVGDTLLLDRLALQPGENAVFDKIQLAEFPDGEVIVGQPHIPDASVTAAVDNHSRGEKLRIFKMRRRKKSRRAAGHRQDLTQITIRAVQCAQPAAAK